MPVELNGIPISDTSSRITDPQETVLDRDWVKSSFLISNQDLPDDETIVSQLYYTSATRKYTDTTLGGNIGVNARPQFTRYSDIRNPGRLMDRTPVTVGANTGNHGMGNYYSASIDDNAQTIFMTFGIPQHNSLANFVTNAFSPAQSRLARTGRGQVLAEALGVVVGGVAAYKLFGVGRYAKLALLYITGRVASNVLQDTPGKFYTMKPAMYLYWSAVNSLVSDISVNLGILPRSLQTTLRTDGETAAADQQAELDQEWITELSNIFPDVVSDTNFIDVYKIANRTHRQYAKERKRQLELGANITEQNFLDYLKGAFSPLPSTVDTPLKGSFMDYIRSVFDFSEGYSGLTTDSTTGELSGFLRERSIENLDIAADADTGAVVAGFALTGSAVLEATANAVDSIPNPVRWLEQSARFYSAELSDGSKWAVFKVDHTGSASESFSTSVGESSLVTTINGMSGTARSMKFTLGGGDLGDGPIAEFMEAIMGFTAATASSAIHTFTGGFSNIVGALAGGGYIDIPKQWENSTVSLTKMSYTMQLVSPYGNPISRLQNIYLPLAMILAGMLPLATGKASYTSPFLCNLFDRGRTQIDLGIMDSVSITRGTSNLGFNNQGSPLAIDVSFSVLDLSTIMHMPVSNGKLFGIDMGIDTDNVLGSYLATVTGLDLFSQFYLLPRAKIKLAKKLFRFDQFKSSAGWAMFVTDELLITSQISSILKIVTPTSNTIRGIENR